MNVNLDIELIKIQQKTAKLSASIMMNVNWAPLLVTSQLIVGILKEAINATVSIPIKLTVQKVTMFYVYTGTIYFKRFYLLRISAVSNF